MNRKKQFLEELNIPDPDLADMQLLSKSKKGT